MEIIQRAIDYIEENLTQELIIEELAGVAALSPFYFQRLFRRLVKTPVREYTRLRRLAKICELLRDTDRTVLDIAEEYHFSGHANFTRAFKKAFNITPDEMRHVHTMMNQYVKPNLLLKYVMVDEGVPLIADGIVLEIVRKRLEHPKHMIGIAEEIPISDIMGGQDSGISVTGAMWDKFHRMKPTISGLLPGGKECGVVYMGEAKEGHCMYLAGAEAAANPARDYVIYEFEAETFDELVTSTVYIAQTFVERWMEKHSLLAGEFAVEMYAAAGEGAACMETWLDYKSLASEEI
ncbi:helix-turn-helix transcriptional regulator [Hungatella sp. L12]|uniref:Helix-turn-helix transcriptional regulator n=1 Tax=Hungatella hominis TaxID=2763050 RepID=A0ABR7H007_9FIRM|nr:AraC family transcriptional regulator [Hungatella hominis]MBC5706508.1 helix-turn-helix transcriptional regulator [Hungatella hominis]